MLSQEDNELLSRVGPGTAMGELMRQYWLPAIRSDELPAADCAPLRVKLLGEELIGYRTTSGKVGLMQSACPHRGASIFFGRNEEEGLRCVYHGWKFDITGGRYEETDYEATGSGGLFAGESLKKSHSADCSRDEGLRIAVQALTDASDEDRATGGVDLARKIFPVVCFCDESGIARAGNDEIESIFRSITGAS